MSEDELDDMDDVEQNEEERGISNPLSTIFKKGKLPIPMPAVGIGCIFSFIAPIIIVIVIVLASISPIEANTVYMNNSGVENNYGKKKTEDWAGFKDTDSEKATFYKKLAGLAKEYDEDYNIQLDVALISSIMFYQDTVNPEEDDFECIEEELKDDEGNVSKGDCVANSEKSRVDATKLYKDAKKIASAMVSDGQLVSEDEFKKWLKDDFIEDKLEDIGMKIPTNPTKKSKFFDRTIVEIYQLRDLYVDLTYENYDNKCNLSSTADNKSKKKVRLTSYQYNSPSGENVSIGGSIGPVEPYVKEGTISFDDNGYAIWKGGTKSKSNGKVYGESGKEYLIVATATKYLVGQFGYAENDKVQYFEYNDTFTLEITPPGRSTKTYSAIVLDSCGACMDWSTTSNGVYKPVGSKQIQLCNDTNNIKIDVFTNQSGSNGLVSPGEVGFFMNGTNGNTCIGNVDIGEVAPGWNDTKGLDGKTLIEIFSQGGLDELNQQIKDNAKKYGEGTGMGAASAAITLINGIKTQGYRLNYYWGGGHGGGDATIIGVNPQWGKYVGPSYEGVLHPYLSMDCSGFVNWAIRNGGCKGHVGGTTRTMETYGTNIRDATKLKPGDLLVNDAHVSIVVQNNGGKVIVAESNPIGIVFTKYEDFVKYSSPYTLKDMSGWYAKNCK